MSDLKQSGIWRILFNARSTVVLAENCSAALVLAKARHPGCAVISSRPPDRGELIAPREIRDVRAMIWSGATEDHIRCYLKSNVPLADYEARLAARAVCYDMETP